MEFVPSVPCLPCFPWILLLLSFLPFPSRFRFCGTPSNTEPSGTEEEQKKPRKTRKARKIRDPQNRRKKKPAGIPTGTQLELSFTSGARNGQFLARKDLVGIVDLAAVGFKDLLPAHAVFRSDLAQAVARLNSVGRCPAGAPHAADVDIQDKITCPVLGIDTVVLVPELFLGVLARRRTVDPDKSLAILDRNV